MLRFSTCKFIDEGHHIILKGASGNGKTYIACALGNAACRCFKSVQYIRMPELLDELNIARGILMDLVAALRFDRDLQEWYDSMTPEEREETFGSHNEPLEDDLLI